MHGRHCLAGRGHRARRRAATRPTSWRCCCGTWRGRAAAWPTCWGRSLRPRGACQRRGSRRPGCCRPLQARLTASPTGALQWSWAAEALASLLKHVCVSARLRRGRTALEPAPSGLEGTLTALARALQSHAECLEQAPERANALKAALAVRCPLLVHPAIWCQCPKPGAAPRLRAAWQRWMLVMHANKCWQGLCAPACPACCWPCWRPWAPSPAGGLHTREHRRGGLLSGAAARGGTLRACMQRLLLRRLRCPSARPGWATALMWWQV